MSSFTTQLIVSPRMNGRDWELKKSFVYHIGSKFSRKYVVVPKGFVTDFASTPGLLWSWLPPFGHYTKAAVLHDWIYKTHWINHYSRKKADQIFYEAMLVGKTPKWKAKMMYWGVRIGGWLAWH